MKDMISRSSLETLARAGALLPQELLQEVATASKALVIGVPREVELQENRLCLTPDAVAILVSNGHEVYMEAGAGTASQFQDTEYSEAGAQIVYSNVEVYRNAHIILKVSPPTVEEVGLMSMGATLVSALQMSRLNKEYIDALVERKITAVGFELLQDEIGGLPIVRAMSEIAGSTTMLIAAEYLNSNNNGRGIILGGITGVPPTKVVILGAGTVGEFAARTALGLGAEVKVFDNELYKLRRIKQELGHHIFTSTFDVTYLTDALRRADVVIGALRHEEDLATYMVSEEMVSMMKKNAVIVDVSIDQGGCFETSELTSHSRPTFKKYDVIHYCVPNIASRVAHTASTALSNILTPVLLQAHRMGGIEEILFEKGWFMKGVYTYKGHLTNKSIARRLGLRHRDLNLFRISKF